MSTHSNPCAEASATAYPSSLDADAGEQVPAYIMEQLLNAARDLSLSRNVATLMAVVRRVARALTQADGATFVLRDGAMCFYADEDAIGPLWKGQRFAEQACVSGWCILHREPVIIEDIYDDPRVPLESYRNTFVRSLAVVPIRRTDPVGAIGCYWSSMHLATPMQVQTLQALADLAAVAVENVQLYEDLRQRVDDAQSNARNQALLARAGEILTASLEEQVLLNGLGGVIVPEFADCCSVDLIDGARVRQIVLSQSGILADCRDGAAETLPWADKLSSLGTAFSHAGKPAYWNMGDADDADTTYGAIMLDDVRRMGMRACMWAPLFVRGRTLGTMAFASARPDRLFAPDDLQLAIELARRCATAIESSRLYREAQQSIRGRDEFLSIASHELRTPLTALQLDLHALRRRGRLSDTLDMRMHKRIDRIVGSAERLVALVDNLLDVSRISLARLNINREALDLSVVVQHVTSRLALQAEGSGSELLVNTAAPVEGMWDRVRMEQLITNLLANAIKYGERKAIEISTRRAEQHAFLEVRDHGMGISKADRERIFGRFERAVPSRHYGGLGLGLFICREVVAAHGGCISVQSEPGHGSTFTVKLPCSSQGRLEPDPQRHTSLSPALPAHDP